MEVSVCLVTGGVNQFWSLGYSGVCQEKVTVFSTIINKKYIDEQFRMYFFNYPETESIQSVQEYEFWQFILGNRELDIQFNKTMKEIDFKQNAFIVCHLPLCFKSN